MHQEAFFCKGPHSKYFWLCGSYGLSCNYLVRSYSWKTTIDNKQTHRQDCVPITFIYKSEICNSVLAWIWPADSSFPTTGGTENPGLWELHAICLKHISFILVMFYGIYLSILIGYI